MKQITEEKKKLFKFHSQRLLTVLETLLRKPVISKKNDTFINDCIDQIITKNYLSHKKAVKLYCLAEDVLCYVINDEYSVFRPSIDIGDKVYESGERIVRKFVDYQACNWDENKLDEHTEKHIELYFRGEMHLSFFQHVAPEKIDFNTI